jgi:hypothetical protein
MAQRVHWFLEIHSGGAGLYGQDYLRSFAGYQQPQFVYRHNRRLILFKNSQRAFMVESAANSIYSMNRYRSAKHK